jgi:hypothetical protein
VFIENIPLYNVLCKIVMYYAHDLLTILGTFGEVEYHPMPQDYWILVFSRTRSSTQDGLSVVACPEFGSTLQRAARETVAFMCFAFWSSGTKCNIIRNVNIRTPRGENIIHWNHYSEGPLRILRRVNVLGIINVFLCHDYANICNLTHKVTYLQVVRFQYDDASIHNIST